jgi:hypothetical protein
MCIYQAALAGAPDLPADVSEWALEMAQRRPYRADIVEQIRAHRAEQAAANAGARAFGTERWRDRRERSEVRGLRQQPARNRTDTGDDARSQPRCGRCVAASARPECAAFNELERFPEGARETGAIQPVEDRSG